MNEATLLQEIERIWGPAGAHADILRSLINERDRLRALLEKVRMEIGSTSREKLHDMMKDF